MSAQVEYINHPCPRCMRETDHIVFKYSDRGSLVCSVCRCTTPVEKEIMKKTYTIVSIDEKDHNSGKRRSVVVELQCYSEPDSLGERESKTETIVIEYAAYGNTHYHHSMVHHPSKDIINFVDAKAISKEISRFIGKGD